MTSTSEQRPMPHTTGRVLHSAGLYDLMVWVYLHGRERSFRERIVELARVQPGESVLDIGCGTGTLAIVAKRCAGPMGAVSGIDASPEMIARARAKARLAGVDVAFENAVVESLPFPDAAVDVVLSTMMFHHLPRRAREAGAREVRRVLKPGGRVLVVDFGAPEGHRPSLLSRIHRHGHLDVRGIVDVLYGAGLDVTETGAVGTKGLSFVRATTP